MKILKLAALVSVLLLSQITFADNTAKDQGDIEQAVASYVKCIDTQNADQLNKTLLPSASFVTYNEMTNKIDNYSTSQFVNLVKSGQKGGWQRNVAITNITFEGNTAVAKFDITDSRIKESGFVTLVKDNGTWKITGQVSNLQLNKK